MTDRIAELDGLPPAVRTDPAAVSARAAVLAADLVEPARATALEKLDEGYQAHRVATDWLRSKALARSAPPELAPIRTLKAPHVSQTHTLRRRRMQPSPRCG